MESPKLPSGCEWYAEYPPDQADRLRQTMDLYEKLDVPQDLLGELADGSGHWSYWFQPIVGAGEAIVPVESGPQATV